MEPVTHTLAGAVLARSGLNRFSAYTTVAMAVAAEFPDIDTAWGFFGPVESFQHHRGITHTFLGLPFEAAVILGGAWAFDRWQRARGTRVRDPEAHRAAAPLSTATPVRWGVLYIFILLALLSHIALDWTNNYGVRPLFPFDAHWHNGSLLFIFDPLLFVFLVSALALPGLFRLISAEVGAAAKRYAPRRWSIGCLLLIALLLGFRAVEHSRAVDLAVAENEEFPASTDPASSLSVAVPLQVEVSPDPFSPFRWHGAADYGAFLQLEEIDTAHGIVNPGDERLDKPPRSPALESALRSPLGRVYLDWSPMPALGVSGGVAEGSGSGGAANAIVFFRDPRFMGAVPLLSRDGAPPLTGTVEVDARNNIVGQAMDGREEPSSPRPSDGRGSR